jgi:hypothetical protein
MVAKVELIVLLLVVRAPVVILATPELVVCAAVFFSVSENSAGKSGGVACPRYTKA